MKKKAVHKVTIGTRGSKLALWQARWIRSELLRLHPDIVIDLVKIKTTGDKITDVPLANVGGKGLFVKEIEEALLNKKADLAVHSMKDVPTEFPEGLHLAVICAREDPRDAFVSRLEGRTFAFKTFRDLPEAAKVGTSSLRRACQLLHLHPDLRIEQLRGNLDTRLRKLDEGQYDAIILAAAGIKRLGLHRRITEILSFDVSLSAIGQGAIGIECRLDDPSINSLIAPLNHRETSLCVQTERAFLQRLEGGCQVPIAAHARLEKEGSLILDGLVGSVDGKTIIRGHMEGRSEEAGELGKKLADDILSKGAKAILDKVYGRVLPADQEKYKN